MEKIQFQNQEFKVREIELPEFGNVLISTTSLNDLLLREGKYTSNYAIEIDERIFYFVDQNEIELGEANLINLVSSQLV